MRIVKIKNDGSRMCSYCGAIPRFLFSTENFVREIIEFVK